MSYDAYDYNIDKYIQMLPSYLQNKGSLIYNEIRLAYDILNNYKNIWVDIWKHLDLDYMENQYFDWKLANPLLPDSDWPYNKLLEMLCKTYDINREHPVGVLNNRHLIRLLKVKLMGIGFDGTRKKLMAVIDSVFGNTGISIIPITSMNQPATATIYLIRPDNPVYFDDTDQALFEAGYYFLPILGIAYSFITVDSDALIYDYEEYDKNKKYDGN